MADRIQLSRAKGWTMPPNTCRDAAVMAWWHHDRKPLGSRKTARDQKVSFVRWPRNISATRDLLGTPPSSLSREAKRAEQCSQKAGARRGKSLRHGQALWNAGCQEGADEARISQAKNGNDRPNGRILRNLRHGGSPRIAASSSRRRRRQRAVRERLALSPRYGRNVGGGASIGISTAVCKLPSGRAL